MSEFDLHHVFILVGNKALIADRLQEIGLEEGVNRVHKGQGTANRKFNFSNGTLEFLYIHDEKEATTGAGKNLLLAERLKEPSASPFGVIVSPVTAKETHNHDNPFDGWTYQPDYFSPPWAFHVGENSSNIREPICFYMPQFATDQQPNQTSDQKFSLISHIRIVTPSPLSNVLQRLNAIKRLTFESGDSHHMEIIFDNGKENGSKDFRPGIPLTFIW